MSPLPVPDAFFLPCASGQRLCVYHAPQDVERPARAALVYVHPFAEEMNKSRRMAAMQARALAAQQCAVLQIDLMGCGDSSGLLSDARWADWQADVQAACDWLVRRHAAAPLWLWGVRAGALLALDVAATRQPAPQLLLWQPLTAGKTLVQQFLRLKAAASLSDGAAAKTAMAELRQALAAGATVDIAGYPLSAGLVQDLEAAVLASPPADSAVHWLEVSPRADAALAPASVRVVEAWQAAGRVVHAAVVMGPSFWQTSEIEDAPALLQATLAAVCGAATAQVVQAMPAALDHAAREARAISPPVSITPGVQEHCLRFACQGETLQGVVSQPAQPSSVGLVIVVGGPQYRVGSHRQFALLARHLAASGHAVLRFDYRGMGDASGDVRDFLAVDGDIAAAITALRLAVPAVQRVALWGLCDGASASLLYHDTQPQAHPDAPLAGLCLLNPWVRSAQTQAAAQVKHYYAKRLTEAAFWRKLLRGEVGLGRLAELAGSLRAMRSGQPRAAAGSAARPLGFQQRMARAWHRADCPVLLVLSGNDLTAREFVEALASDPAWHGALQRPLLQQLALPQADHTCADDTARTAVEQATAAWLQRLAAPATGVGHRAAQPHPNRAAHAG